LIYHLFLQPVEIKPEDLFKPVVQTTHTPMAETDYNFHKSNSTYFTDLDIARTHLATAILRKGIRGVKDEKGATFSFRNTSRAAGHNRRHNIDPLGSSGQANSETGAKGMTAEDWYRQATQPGPLLIALGAVTCQFHREIPPYKRYEIWTRLLTWDRKWMYIVSHFVERGAFKPTGYSLQPRKRRSMRVEQLTEEDKAELKKKIFASSMAKYVVKKGRLTIPPELVLERSQMLPARPAGAPILGGWTPSQSKDTTPERTATPSPEPGIEDPTAANRGYSNGSLGSKQAVLEEDLVSSTDTSLDDADGWTWERVEEHRIKGLRLAEAFDYLDGLKDVYELEGEEVMGRYTDLVFNF
jgi:hypothetical protein